MPNVSKVVMPPEDIVRLVKGLHVSQLQLARRLGITNVAMQQWRARGASTTVAVVISTLSDDAIPEGDQAAFEARIDALRQDAVRDGYDEERVSEILAEVAQALAAKAAFEASTGAPINPLHIAKALVGLKLSEQALADEVGYHVDSVENWLTGKSPPNALVRFWIRRCAAVAMVDIGDGADPLSRAIGDLIFDARYGGWEDDQIQEILENAENKFSRVPA